ncbi:MAG TPA: NUDIX domain-containing protein [bacterium]|nr:NUDIX domain-containing protein [bacterium]
MIIVQNETDEILFVKRKISPAKGKWDLPGGFMELYENCEKAAMRELYEETNLKVHNIKYLGSTTDVYPYKGDKYPTVVLAYKTQVRNAQVKANDDAEDFHWFKINNIPTNKLAFKCIKWTVDQIKN